VTRVLPPRVVGTYSIPVEKDAEGFPLCRQCKTSIRTGKRPKQRTFCGNPACLHLWKLKSDPGYQAKHVLERDKGVCQACGLDCLALLGELKLTAQREADVRFGVGKHITLWAWAGDMASRLPEFAARCDALALPRHLRGLVRRLWEMDHIVPVIEGGGSCGLENLRTLCWACHRKETAALAARRAEARRAG
jgi:5-methylcytosine-specific restriction protein A